MTRSWHVWALALIGLLTAALVAVWSLQPERAREPGEVDDGEGRAVLGHDPSPAGVSRRSVLPTTAGIHGRIVEAGSGPLTEGRIDLYCLGSAYHVSTAVGEDGEFEAPACANGPTCVRLVHPGFEQPHGWELESNSMVELEARAAPKLSGVVVGPEGQVVAGAELLVQRGASRIALGSDSEGEFAVASPRVRPCDRCDVDDAAPSCRDEPTAPDSELARVLVSAPKLAPIEVEVALDADAPVEIVLAAAAPAIGGRVLGGEGEPFDERTRVLAINRARDHERHAADVDARGRFRFENLAMAEYSLRAIRDEREIAQLALARPGDEVELRSDLPARGSTLSLELIDPDGDPIAGARIDGGPWRAAISDAQGRVEAPAVLPGNYTVRVRAGDCPPIREIIELEPDAGGWLRRVQLPGGC